VAIDDSKRTLVLGVLRPGADAPETRSIPNEPRHLRRLIARLTREGSVRVCYEAGPSGYDLSRQLTARDVPCQVMAPALTPRKPGDRIKTDHRDAAKRVRLFRAGELTPIRVPDEAAEAGRDLLRCREDVQEDLLRWRHRLGKFLARHGRVYREGRNWTQRHWTWIRSQHFTLPTLERTLAEYRCAVEQLLARVADLTREIAALAETAPYREPVGGLRCFRGIDTLAAMTLLAELGDVQRFDHPRQLMAYLGLVPSEHSSGDRTQRGSITKAGNLHVRRILVEACWHYRHPPRLGAALARRSQGQPPAILAQAWRAQLRLHRRYRHLVGHGKRPPIAVVACARELAGFLWAALTQTESVAQAA
jgi:transposase